MCSPTAPKWRGGVAVECGMWYGVRVVPKCKGGVAVECMRGYAVHPVVKVVRDCGDSRVLELVLDDATARLLLSRCNAAIRIDP